MAPGQTEGLGRGEVLPGDGLRSLPKTSAFLSSALGKAPCSNTALRRVVTQSEVKNAAGGILARS